MKEKKHLSLEQEKLRLEHELAVQRQIAFATGLFQKDITIRTLLESLGQGVLVVDSNGYILYMNARAEQMFAYPCPEIIGKHHNVIIPYRLREIHDKHMENYFHEPKIRPMGQGLDLVGLRKDGTEFPVEIALSFVRIQDTLLVLALVSDITLRNEAEIALKERAKELAEANEALESFSYSVSHDLRSPLIAIIGFCNLLLEDAGSKLNESELDALRRIYSSGQRMNELINDILSLSQVTRKKLITREIDLTEISKSIMNDLRKTEPDHETEVIIHGNMKALGDPHLIRIVMTNLISNAWKYSKKVENPCIEIGMTKNNEHTTFFVRDNGVGFDMQYASNLFTPFQRLHEQADFPGTGVGLATVSRIINRHHGKIWAESSPGKGAIFYFELGSENKG